MTCRKCKWFAVPLDGKGRRRIAKNRKYECEVNLSKTAAPHSITLYFHAAMKWDGTVAISRHSMLPDEGATCPTFEERK